MRLFPLMLGMAALSPLPSRGDVLISEFMADNASGIEDADGDKSDWIELFNTGGSAVNLDGWWLTDDSANPVKWRFPAVSIPAGGTMLVWASGKDRRNPAQPLHTDFALSRNGEYLALYRPDPGNGQPLFVQSFGTSFPPQAPDVSYGLQIAQSTSTPLATGHPSRYRVLSNDAVGSAQYSGTNYGSGHIGTGQSGGWNMSPAFADSTWTACVTGLGYDTNGNLNPWISSDCQSALRNVNTSLCFRAVFTVGSPAAGTSYKLRMKYEDGFVAWINGVEVARANFNGTPAYDSTAASALDETIVNSWTEFTIPPQLIVAGNNLLAVQGLNSSASSSDFLLLPEVTAVTPLTPGPEVYFNPATPGALNGAGTAGPLVFDATPADHAVPRPLGNASSPPLFVTVKVKKTRNNLGTVRAIHRTMWNPESTVNLNDSGTAPDLIAGDGVYSGSLPTSGVATGQMFRWRFEAQDDAGVVTRLPAYQSTTDSPQYFGTVALNAATASSQLPVLEWFVEGSPATGPTSAAFRGSCYFLNRFYDNTGHEIHGQSTAGFTKKSYDFDSNDNFRFVWREGERPVKDLNLLSNYADKTKVRNTLAHEVGELAGTPAHFAFPVRVQLNAGFHGVMDLVEDGDDRFLDRVGLDPEGAFYKIYSENLTTGAEKKTRKEEPHTDLAEFAAALDPGLSLGARRSFAYDQLDIPATVNYLVTRQLNHDRDHGHKNFYLYRDTNGSREWRPVIWDVDLSYGHVWNGTEGYFDDDLISNNPLNGHSNNNRIYNLIYESAEMREMYVRRMRTLMDTIQQPPGTSNGLLETRMRQIAASVDPDPANPSPWTDGDLDAAKWGIDGRFSQNRPREEVERVITGYLAPRRAFLFNTSSTRPLIFKPGLTPDSSNSTAIPTAAQTNTAGMVTIDSVDYLPASGTQSQEYIILRNTTTQAVDVSGWRVSGAVEHVIQGGTVIPAGSGRAGVEYRGLLHLAKDALAFRQRTTGPKGGEKRLVQGDYKGQLSARGEAIELRDASGLLIASFSYAGAPTAHQQHLRVSEIQYHPAEPSPAESAAMPGVSETDFEYLELTNTGTTALALGGVSFSEGLSFTFPSHSLAAGGRVVLARNPAAFALRHPGMTATVLGPYEGELANSGERLEIIDPVGEVILDFEYKDGWYPATDGSGRSLVLRDPAATPHDDFANPLRWAISSQPAGNPGQADTSFAQAYHGWDNFHFTAVERDNPLVSGPAADPDGDGRPNSEEYAFATDPRKPDAPSVAFSWHQDGSIRRPAVTLRRPAGAIDVIYQLLGGSTPDCPDLVVSPSVTATAIDGSTEEAWFSAPAGEPEPSSHFLRVRATVSAE